MIDVRTAVNAANNYLQSSDLLIVESPIWQKINILS